MGNEVELPDSSKGPHEVSGHEFKVRTVRWLCVFLQAYSIVQSWSGRELHLTRIGACPENKGGSRQGS